MVNLALAAMIIIMLLTASQINRMATVVARLSVRVNSLKGKMSENADAITAVVAQLSKARDEIVGKIDALEAAIAAGEDLSGPMAELRTVAQTLDDVVPDPVVEEPPVEEPEV